MDYEIIRSNRKTISLVATPEGVLLVRAPIKTSKKKLDEIVKQKEKWITTHLAIQQQRAAQKAEFCPSIGTTLQLLGRDYRVEAQEGNKAGFDGKRFYLPEDFPAQNAKRLLVELYKKLATQHIPQRVELFAQQMGLHPTAVKINNAKTRWGSCSSAASINFSWRLMLADEDCVDYVVVHELAHLVWHDHSKNFWAEVEKVLPDYTKRRARLRTLAAKLAAEDWD